MLTREQIAQRINFFIRTSAQATVAEVEAMLAEARAEGRAEALDREHVAAALMLLDDVEPNDVWWRWQANAEHAKAGHDGDCTDQAHTCAVCIMERSLKEADWFIRILAALAAPAPEGKP